MNTEKPHEVGPVWQGTTRSSATAEIARVGGRYAVQGYSRSLMLVSIQSPYATSYYIPSRIVLQLSHNIGHIIAFDKGVPLVNALILGNLCKYRHKSYC